MSAPCSRQRTRLAVLAVWLAMTVYMTTNVARRVVDLPVQDDFAFVDQITGDVSVSLAWLWEPHNEHRIPLPKLAIVFITRAFGIDFRVVPFVSVALLAAAALACVLTLARYRGQSSFADAIVPVLVCSWAQSETLIWTTTIQLAAATAFALLWWCPARSSDARPTATTIGLAGGCAAAATTSGGNGVVLLAGMAPWFAWTALRAQGRGRIVAAGFAVSLAAFAGTYLYSYERVAGHPAPATLGDSVRFGLRLIASSWSVIADLHDILGLGLVILLAWACFRVVRVRSVESASSVALLMGTIAVIGAVVIGRAGFGIDTVSSRYVTLVTPLVVATIALIESALRTVRRETLSVLAVLALLSFSAADRRGHGVASSVQKRLKAARADLLAGRPDAEVVIEHQLFPGTDYAVPRLEMLRRVRGSVFRDMPAVR